MALISACGFESLLFRRHSLTPEFIGLLPLSSNGSLLPGSVFCYLTSVNLIALTWFVTILDRILCFLQGGSKGSRGSGKVPGPPFIFLNHQSIFTTLDCSV